MSEPQNLIVAVNQSNVVITNVRINIYSVVLHWVLRCACYMLGENDEIIKQEDIIISGDEYNSWTDDTELTDLILSKLGLTRKIV